MADITLPAQPVFDTHRSIPPKEFMLTRIHGELYFSTPQACDALEITPQNWSNRMVSQEATNKGGTFELYPLNGEENKEGVVQRNPDYWKQSYSIPVTFAPVAAVGGGGGTQLMQFHHTRKVLEEALTLRDPQKRTHIVNYLINLGNDVLQQGFVIDQHAAKNDPLVIPKLLASTPALNFTPLRQRAANKSHEMDWVFKHCSDSCYADGSINKAALSHFRRCMYNTTYLAVLGMTALQVRYTRANPNVIDFGLLNFRNQLPGINCIKTALNYFHDDELLQNNGFMDLGFAAILGYIRVTGPLTSRQALSIYYHRLATLSEFIKTPEMPWWECPVTAVDTIINMPPDVIMRAELRLHLLTYWELLPKWKELSTEDIDRLRTAQNVITEAAIEGTDDNGDPIQLSDATE